MKLRHSARNLICRSKVKDEQKRQLAPDMRPKKLKLELDVGDKQQLISLFHLSKTKSVFLIRCRKILFYLIIFYFNPFF